MIISINHEISLNIRHSGNGTTPQISLSATAIANPKATDGFLDETSVPTTIGASQVLNAGWTSSNIVLTFDVNRSLNDTDIVTMVASPYTSGCDPLYPDFCIRPPPPLINCDQIAQKNFKVFPPESHGLDKDKDSIGCEANE